MARVTKGNLLFNLTLQPGWTIEEDGFGLLTSRLTFVTSHEMEERSTILNEAPARGVAHPKDPRLTCHRASTTYGANGLATIVAEYIGIAGGNMTTPEVSGRGNMSQDPIQTHPDFNTVIGGTASAPLNGAKFNETTGLFVGFGYTAPPTNKEGVRSYLNPGFGISGHFYTSDLSIAAKLKNEMGRCSANGKWVGINLVSGLAGVASQAGSPWGNEWESEQEIPQLLLTGIAIDFFGTLIKVSYDITFARYGWDLEIYKYTSPV